LFAHFKDIKRYGNYEKYLGLIHDPKRDKESDDLVRSDVVSDNWLRNDLASDRFLRDYVAKDDFLRDDIVLDELIHEDIISDNWLRDDFVSKETVVDKYDASFDIVVINKSNGETVYTGTLENNGEINVPNLLAGEYDLILSGSGIFETKTATVTVNGVTLVDFNSNIDGVPVRVDLEKKYDEPIKLAKIYLDSKILEKIYSNPITLVVIYDPDIVLGNIYDPDIILESKYLDSINLDPISLGYDARIYVN
jgi:hypothetical protein